MNDRVEQIKRQLVAAFGADADIAIKDQSHLHAGHEGAKEGKGHFDVTIVSEKFDGLNRIARHRLVYDALGSFMDTDIHALRITAHSTAER